MTGSMWRLVLHYVEMLLAMAAGMLVVQPLLDSAIRGISSRAEVDSLVMVTSMSVTMAAWMRFRGHRLRPIVEMSLAMYAGFAVLFPLLWTGHLDAHGLTTGGHVLMLLFMLVAMLARPGEYAAAHARALPASRGDDRISRRRVITITDPADADPTSSSARRAEPINAGQRRRRRTVASESFERRNR